MPSEVLPPEAWIDRATLEYQFPGILRNWTQNDFIQDWVRGRAALNVKKSDNKQQRHPYEPCYLYERGDSFFRSVSDKGCYLVSRRVECTKQGDA